MRCNLGDANIYSRPFEGFRCVYTITFCLVLGTIADFDCQAVYGMPSRLGVTGDVRHCPSARLVSVSAPIWRRVNYHFKLNRGGAALEVRLNNSWRVVKSIPAGFVVRCAWVIYAVVPRCAADILLYIDRGLHMCMHMCMCRCICVYVQVCIFMYVYTCVYVSTHMLTLGHVRVQTHTRFCLVYLQAPLHVPYT